MNLNLLAPLLPRAAWFGALVLLDFLTGLFKAVVTKTFQWQKLADVLKNNALYFVGWLAVELTTLIAAQLGLSELVNQLGGYGALALYTATMTRSIAGNISAILNALKLTGNQAAG